MSEATFYAWKKKYAHLGATEVLRIRQLADENARLKCLVADLTLDKHMLAENHGYGVSVQYTCPTSEKTR